MSETTRKLATIVALDVAGYSARTEADEAKTTTEVAALRGVIEGIAKGHGGRVFNTAGDGFMLEFSSSLDAVEAALELAEKCRPQVRVGVHLGDVVVQANGDLLGHGVNVAAAETIEAYALAGTVVAALAQPRSTEPMLAVLPFDNLSNDPEMQFFSDGVSEEILQVLARAGLRVIGRSSAFQFRGPRKGEAARLLGATHVLDGAVRKSGARLRVTAQLIEAGGAALWSERYDQDLADIFELQDDVAAKVASSLQSVLRPSPRNRKIDPRAYELYLKALEGRTTGSQEAYQRSQILLEEAVALAPDFADAWGLLGGARTLLLPNDRDDTSAPEYKAALAATQRALALDPSCARAYLVLANLSPPFAEYAEKIALAQRGVELAPNDHGFLSNLGSILTTVGRCKDALQYFYRSAALDPMNPVCATEVATVLGNLGQDEEAHAYLEQVWKVQPPHLWTAAAKFLLLFNASRFTEAAAYLDGSILGANESLGPIFRTLLVLPSLPRDQVLAIFQNRLEPAPGRALVLTDCTMAARFGCADLVFERLFAAIDDGRPIIGSEVGAFHGPRTMHLNHVFLTGGAKAFRDDARFPRFCARIGLVDYWRTSGHWPDCANETPYDFKAECEKASKVVRS